MKMNKTQVDYVANALWRIMRAKCDILDHEAEQLQIDVSRQVALIKIQQIRDRTAQLQEGVVPTGRHIYIDEIFTFDNAPIEVINAALQHDLKELQTRKARIEQEKDHVKDMTILGDPDDALSALSRFRNWQP